MRTITLVLIALLFSAAAVFGSEPFAVVVYAEGSEVSLYRNSILAQYRPDRVTLAGMPLYAGDILQTETGTVLEIQLYPEADRIILPPSSSLEILSLGDEPVLELSYGRIRLSARRGHDTPVTVTAGPITMRSGNGDIGITYRIDPDAPEGIALIAAAAVLEGQLDIDPQPFQKALDSGAAAQPDADQPEAAPSEAAEGDLSLLSTQDRRLIRTGILDTGQQEAVLLSSVALSESDFGFWESMPFRGKVVEAGSAEAVYSLLDYRDELREDPRHLPTRQLPEAEAPLQETAEIRDQGQIERSIRVADPEQRYFLPDSALQNIGIGVFSLGAVTELLGITALLFGDALLTDLMPEAQSRRSLSYGMLVSGGVMMGLSTGFFFLSYGF